MKPFSLRISPKPFKTFFQPAPLLLSGGRLSRKNKDPNVKPRQPTIWATRPPLSGAAMGANPLMALMNAIILASCLP